MAEKLILSTYKQLPTGLMGRYEFLMNRPAQRIREMTEKSLAPLKIAPKQYRILATINQEGPSSQRAVGEMLKIDRSTMVLLTDELEQRKLLVRKDHPQDRRYYLLHLTAAGMELLQLSQKRVMKAEQDFLTPLTKTEKQDLRKCLSKLFQYIPILGGNTNDKTP